MLRAQQPSPLLSAPRSQKSLPQLKCSTATARAAQNYRGVSIPFAHHLILSSANIDIDQNNSTAPATVVITAAPSSPLSSASSTPTSTSSPSTSKPVPVAAIAAPIVIGVLAIVGIIGLLFFLRRRKAAKKAGIYAPPTYTPRGELGHDEVQEVPSPAQEVMGDSVKYQYELETRPAELEGSKGPKSGNAGYRF